MQEWSKENKGFRYILNVIDVFSKYLWSIPLKNKTGAVVVEAFKSIVKNSKTLPKFLWVDKGKEFYNQNMDRWLDGHNIKRYSTFGNHKSCVVERLNRTLKEKMWKRFTAENTRNWVTMIDNLVENYNKSFHTTIGMSPVEARMEKNYQIAVENTLSKTNKNMNKKPKFKLNDKVRISRIKSTFEKGYLPNWSEAVYFIHEIKYTTPITYILKDELGEILEGGFYENELQKTDQNIYRIEKVLRKKKTNGIEYALVKWMGYSNKFNQWIKIDDLTKLTQNTK